MHPVKYGSLSKKLQLCPERPGYLDPVPDRLQEAHRRVLAIVSQAGPVTELATLRPATGHMFLLKSVRRWRLVKVASPRAAMERPLAAYPEQRAFESMPCDTGRLYYGPTDTTSFQSGTRSCCKDRLLLLEEIICYDYQEIQSRHKLFRPLTFSLVRLCDLCTVGRLGRRATHAPLFNCSTLRLSYSFTSLFALSS